MAPRRKRMAAPAASPAAAKSATPSIMTAEGLDAYRAELLARQADTSGKIKALQARVQAEMLTLVGMLNQTAGALAAIDKILGPKAAG